MEVLFEIWVITLPIAILFAVGFVGEYLWDDWKRRK